MYSVLCYREPNHGAAIWQISSRSTSGRGWGEATCRSIPIVRTVFKVETGSPTVLAGPAATVDDEVHLLYLAGPAATVDDEIRTQWVRVRSSAVSSPLLFFEKSPPGRYPHAKAFRMVQFSNRPYSRRVQIISERHSVTAAIRGRNVFLRLHDCAWNGALLFFDH